MYLLPRRTSRKSLVRQTVMFDTLEHRRLLCASEDDCTEALSRAVVAVNAGGAAIVDSNGQAYVADGEAVNGGFEGGRSIRLNGAIGGTADDELFATSREGKSFIFSARVPNGRYTLTLSFADDRDSVRRFNITAEDQRISTSWRVPSESSAVERKFNVDVRDGRLSLGFDAVSGRAIVSAIVLTPGASIFPGALSWDAEASLPLVREEAQSFVFEDRLYVLGGYFNTPEFQATTRFDRYDPATNDWTRIAEMPTKFTHAGVAVDAKYRQVWFVGGYVGDFPAPDGTATVWRYDIDSNTFTQGPSIPGARGAGGAAIVGRKLYFFGGGNKLRSADSGATWALDLENPTKWRERASMPNPRNHFGVAVVNDQIYVVGGQHLLERDSVNQADVHRYDVTTDSWTAMASLPRQYSHFTTGVFNNRYIVFAGGESPHDVGRSDSFVFDTRRNLWGELTSLPADRRASAGGIIDGRLYVVGGYDKSIGQSSSMWSTDLLPAFM